MAKPIKITPVLKGKDAVNFFNKLVSGSSKEVNKKRRRLIREDAHKLQALLKD
ncbi:MAG: hypothetical protein WD037_11415 [Balneolales bacterium]